jgi:type I restriction enzyme S subunit
MGKNVTYQGELDCNDLKYIELSAANCRKYGLIAGDLLFNRTNSKELVGKSGLWDGRFEAVAASNFIGVRVTTARVASEYVWAYMNTASMNRRLFEMARDAIGQANINAKELKALPLPVPPLPLQRRFADLVAVARGVAESADAAAEKASAISAALIQRLFGEAA